MAAVQYICAKIGLICDCGLAEVMRRHYPRWLVYHTVLSLVTANTIDAARGLDQEVGRARGFYFVLALSTAAAPAVDFLGINTVRILFWTAVINGFLTPPLLAIVMRISNNRAIMGARINGRWLTVLGWTTMVVMAAAAIATVVMWIATV
jgi:Mn2+/Fe2+ NRAMP family transporter